MSASAASARRARMPSAAWARDTSAPHGPARPTERCRYAARRHTRAAQPHPLRCHPVASLPTRRLSRYIHARQTRTYCKYTYCTIFRNTTILFSTETRYPSLPFLRRLSDADALLDRRTNFSPIPLLHKVDFHALSKSNSAVKRAILVIPPRERYRFIADIQSYSFSAKTNFSHFSTLVYIKKFFSFRKFSDQTQDISCNIYF